ncbi:hypothetical protein E2C01_085371 [Portunus trituberculatus]|uniref:Uncharacterized protein n=1 Tax=Portunus trituberculatus TaxID=210409 RepID=A0A5B7JBR1_PORTR|nr:hypothetical protein [Portunus trituberculatus]
MPEPDTRRQRQNTLGLWQTLWRGGALTTLAPLLPTLFRAEGSPSHERVTAITYHRPVTGGADDPQPRPAPHP